ncbi:hypothetical protein L6V77_06385 [Myxococcota bacterium]|nr:hypothetical protein [Myxococcota bacterium]
MTARPIRLVALSAAAGLALTASACDEETKKAPPPPPFTEAAEIFDAPLNAVWVVSATEAWAFGGGGLIVRFDGTTWTEVESPTEEDLLVAWGGGGSLFAAGTGGVVLTRTGDGPFEATTHKDEQPFRAFAATGPDDVWVFGDMGVTLRSTDGADFEEVDVAAVPPTVKAAYLDGTGTGLLVGPESGMGTVTATYQPDAPGAPWKRVPRSDVGIGSITDVSGRVEPQERLPFIWAAGTSTAGNGLLARWQDEKWTTVATGLGDRPNAVLPTDEGVWLGAGSTLIRIDPAAPDTRETQTVPGPVRDLQGVADLLVAVGGNGEGRIWTRVPAAK